MALGVDFGTSFTVATCVVDERLLSIKFDHHSTGLVSSAFLDKAGMLLIGQPAELLAVGYPTRYVSEIKRHLDETAPLSIGDQFTPEKILTVFLGHVFTAAKRQYGSVLSPLLHRHYPVSTLQ